MKRKYRVKYASERSFKEDKVKGDIRIWADMVKSKDDGEKSKKRVQGVDFNSKIQEV